MCKYVFYTYWAYADEQPPPNANADAPIVQPFLPNVDVDRVRVATFLTIYDPDYRPLSNSHYKPAKKYKINQSISIVLHSIQCRSISVLTFIMAFDDILNKVARSLTTLVFEGTSSPFSKSVKARCNASPCFDIKS